MKRKFLWVAGGLVGLAAVAAAVPSLAKAVQDKKEQCPQVRVDSLPEVRGLQQIEIDDDEPVLVEPSVIAEMPDIDAIVAEVEPALTAVAPAVQSALQQVTIFDGDEGPSWLGVETQEVTAENAKELKLPAERGVLIEAVTPDSPAAKAGLKEKDVVTEVNGQRVEGAAQFRRMIREIPAGRTVQLTVWRDGRPQALTATVGKAEERHKQWMRGAAPGGFTFRMPDMDIPNALELHDLGDQLAMLGGRPRLGIDGEDISGQLGSFFGAPDGEGILVRGVNSDSPAEKAGLKAGDVIVSFNGERVHTVGDLREKMAAQTEAQTAKIGVLRNRSETTLTVQLPERASKIKTKNKVMHRTNI